MARQKSTTPQEPTEEPMTTASPDSAAQPTATTTETSHDAPAATAAEPVAMTAEPAAEAAAPTVETVTVEATAPIAEVGADGDAAAKRKRSAWRTLYRYMAISGAAGLVPLPAVDVATVAGVQVKMLHAVAKLYGVSFDTKLAKQIVLAVLSGGGSMALALPAASAAKSLPVAGLATAMLVSPAFASLSCLALGRAFINHFEAGGTLETFDPAQVQPAAEAEPVAAAA